MFRHWFCWFQSTDRTLSLVSVSGLVKHIFRSAHGRNPALFCSVLWSVFFQLFNHHAVSVCLWLIRQRRAVVIVFFVSFHFEHLHVFVFLLMRACCFPYARFLHHLSGWLSLILPHGRTHKHTEATTASQWRQLVIVALQECVCVLMRLSVLATLNLSHQTW